MEMLDGTDPTYPELGREYLKRIAREAQARKDEALLREMAPGSVGRVSVGGAAAEWEAADLVVSCGD